MAVITIAHKPELTKEQAQAIFAAHFGADKVKDFRGFRRDFMVVKNPYVGVALKLEQTGTETKFVYAGLAPALWARVLMGALVGLLLWGSFTKEVEAFIKSAPEFQ